MSWYGVLCFLYAPLAVVALYSFNRINSSAVFAGVSLRWYADLLSDETVLRAFYNSLTLAIAFSVIATVIGTLLDYGMYTCRHRRLGWLIYLPIVMPDIVYAISQMSFLPRSAARPACSASA